MSRFDNSTGIATTYVRYKQVEALIDQGQTRLHQLNLLGIILGWTSSLGMCVVGNFQVGQHSLTRMTWFLYLFPPPILHFHGLSLSPENHDLLHPHSRGSDDLWCWGAVHHGADWGFLSYATTCPQQKHVLDSLKCGSLEHSQQYQQYPSPVTTFNLFNLFR